MNIYDFDIAGMLKEKFGKKVIVRNDAKCACIAEYNNMRAINQAIAGTGFATGTTFAQQILNAKTYCDNNNIDVENVKYIIAYGSVNDYRNGRTISEVNTGFDTFMVNAHTN